MVKNKMIFKISLMLFALVLLFSTTTSIYADSDTAWWSEAGIFFNSGHELKLEPMKSIHKLIFTVGNMVFIAVTVILGVKYIWGSAEDKGKIKDSLITLVVAAFFFYMYYTIQSFVVSGGKLIALDKDSYENTAKNIYSIIMYIANFLAIGGLIYIGVRYMMASAEGKAELKVKAFPIVLGIIMVYSTVNFLNLILGFLD